MNIQRKIKTVLSKKVILAVMWVVPYLLFAQNNITLTGTLVNDSGEAISNATVELRNTEFVTASANDGRFALSAVPPASYTLLIKAIGYQTYEYSIALHQDINLGDIRLEESFNEIQQVTVEGKYYHNYKMDSLSGSLRLPSSLMETPQNIQVISSDLLTDQMAIDMRDGVIRNVSGVTMEGHWSNMFARINMRGSRASAFRNGMNVTGSWGPLTEDMSVVERIEFVKGPAGFMMSNGEPSGIYNVVTKKPTVVTKGEATLTLGSFDLYRTTLDLDGKLSKSNKLLYRLNVMGQSRKTHRALEFDDRYTIAPVISYQVADNTLLTFEYNLQHVTMSNVGSAYVFGNKLASLPRDFSLMERGIEPTKINDQSVFVNLQHSFNQDWQLTAQLAYFHYDQEGSSLWFSPVEENVDIRENGDMRRYVGIWDALGQNKYGQVYVNGKFNTGKVRHRVMGGIDMGIKEYYADWADQHVLDTGANVFNIYDPVYGSPLLSLPDFDRSTDIRDRGKGGFSSQSYTGLYVQDELAFMEDRLRLTLAGRFTHVVESSGVDLNTQRDQSRFTPRIGISGDIDQYTSVYALYDQSFIPQNGLLRNGEQPKPITGNNMEIGVKRDWLKGRFNTTLSAYQILRNNATAADPENNSGENFVVNIGQTTVKGIEFDMKGELAPGLDLLANYAWTDGEITKASEADVNTVGSKIAGFAAHVANAWLNYTVQRGALHGFGVKAGGTLQADRSSWSFSGETSMDELPTYFRLDGGLFWQVNKIAVNLNVNNILNEYLYTGSASGTTYWWQTEPGRNFRLSIGYKF